MADEDVRVIAISLAVHVVVWPQMKSDLVESSVNTQWAYKDKVKV
jgi:hypothetical protein